ncbi:MAG: DinB family protein [Phycisphaerales bacterium JB039]
MQPLKTYDYLTRARSILFDQVRPLTDNDWRRQFDIGLGSLARTLTHLMICEWFYIRRMRQERVPPYDQWSIQDERPPSFDIIEQTWTPQMAETRAALEAVADWDAAFIYPGTDAHGSPRRALVTPADILTQLALHEVHHRAQAMNMLRHLGVQALDLDYNEIAYPWEPA